MRTQYYTASSLDGFIATEDDSLDWLFPLGDFNESSYPAFIAEVGALAMGAGQFHDAGLLDELIIQIGSVTLGRGKQVFPRRVLSPTLQLTEVRQMGGGMVELRYEVGGVSLVSGIGQKQPVAAQSRQRPSGQGGMLSTIYVPHRSEHPTALSAAAFPVMLFCTVRSLYS